MYIHYSIIDLPTGKFVQLKFCSNEFGKWSITEQKNTFFISKEDWDLVCAPINALISQIPSSWRVWDDVNKIRTIPFDKWDNLKILAEKGLGCTLKEHKNLMEDFVLYNPNKPQEPEDFFYEQPKDQGLTQDYSLSKETIELKLRELLNLNPDITFSIIKFDDLKKLYRKAALKFHPDVNNGNSEKMTELNFYWQEYQKIGE